MCLCLSVSINCELTVQTLEGDAAAAKAIAKPSDYILKPQREGGGMMVIYINSVYEGL